MSRQHPLEAWRQDRKLTLSALGDLLGTTPEAAGRYCRGRIPHPKVMAKVVEVTEGVVMPNDFYGLGAPGNGEAPDGEPRG